MCSQRLCFLLFVRWVNRLLFFRVKYKGIKTYTEPVSVIWNDLSLAEKLFMYELANLRIPNPSNHKVWDSLINKGLVAFEPHPTLVDFKNNHEYVLNQFSTKEYDEIRRDVANDTWRLIRVPFIIVLLLLSFLLFYKAGDSINAFIAVFAGIGTLLTTFNQFANKIGANS